MSKSDRPKPTISEKSITGRVKWFNPKDDAKPKSNFGFISRDDGQDIFVHGEGIEDGHYPLHDGDRVVFDVTIGARGPKAIGVKVQP